ncbi:hypothetical protein [Clostridium botulinum]|uniref:hypothetical protein n=1 Tax=Clostridium botulinum TaxID=1491 RepID=UPI001E61E265|nr:hypothetical protein [Clostridium botulinum]MCD3329323.1 hypothetical protein [Clostridium botulinum D/C]MCD3344542.1 hypothetical protein [Clostridium botulinum D/C]MCD3353022.1 hypothetical protein [Clostridium botulinum D/C]
MKNLPWYELMNQNDFEDMIINSLKEQLIITTRQAVHTYEKICKEVSIYSDDCKIDDNTYSIRKYIVGRMKKDGDILKKYKNK